MPDEKSEPPQPGPHYPPCEWEFDLTDAPNEDASAQPLKAAGCSVNDELEQLASLGAKTNV